MFEDKLEIIKYGMSRQRLPASADESSNFINIIESDEETKEHRAMEQAFRIKRKIKYYCLSNNFNLFWTLTFDDSRVNALDYQFSRKRLQAWLKYMRETYGRFGYLFIPELHKSGRIHFHGVTQGFNPPLVEARYPKIIDLLKRKTNSRFIMLRHGKMDFQQFQKSKIKESRLLT